jgi:hypothetical protein
MGCAVHFQDDSTATASETGETDADVICCKEDVFLDQWGWLQDIFVAVWRREWPAVVRTSVASEGCVTPETQSAFLFLPSNACLSAGLNTPKKRKNTEGLASVWDHQPRALVAVCDQAYRTGIVLVHATREKRYNIVLGWQDHQKVAQIRPLRA